MDEEYVYDEPPEIQIVITPRAQAALDELQAMIAARYPDATFSVHTWYDIADIYLKATVDVDDVDEVRDVFRDRLFDIQVEDGENPDAVAMAEAISESQREEIAVMQDLLATL